MLLSVDLVMTQYIEVNVIGIIILLTMLFYIVRMHQDSEGGDQSFFVKMLICNAVILFSDISIYLMRGSNSSILVIINNFVCIIYFLLHGYFGYLWMRYCIKKLYPEFEPGRKLKALFMFPCIICTILIVASPWTKWIYYLTDKNRYMRGSYMWIVVILSYLYWAISVILILKEMVQRRRIREESFYETLLIFPIPTFIGNTIQLMFYGVSVVWVCTAISLLILFINLQNNQISRDMLTGLFNRRQTNKQLDWEINHLRDTYYLLFVIMIDVDHFKEINDEFGHVIGDEALISVSQVLKRGCREKDFIGRFGGDEFIIIGHAFSNNEIDSLIETIKQEVQDYNSNSNSPYIISLSMGYSLYGEKDLLSVDHIISAADKEMYKMKARSKNIKFS